MFALWNETGQAWFPHLQASPEMVADLQRFMACRGGAAACGRAVQRVGLELWGC